MSYEILSVEFSDRGVTLTFVDDAEVRVGAYTVRSMTLGKVKPFKAWIKELQTQLQDDMVDIMDQYAMLPMEPDDEDDE